MTLHSTIENLHTGRREQIVDFEVIRSVPHNILVYTLAKTGRTCQKDLFAHYKEILLPDGSPA
ncbi:hypothetical protein KAR91_74875 [Candidatus Pacearchaeota archaeon]|nr:hypothetical protein [Candidatus Pacearchaeota archaeon]